MKKSKPLVDKDGEVRELLIEDMASFRPFTEFAPSSLVQKLGTETEKATVPEAADARDAGAKAARARKRSAAARKAWQTRRQSTG
jgi:hypothetical protein